MTTATVAVVVPVLNRPHRAAPLVESFEAANDGRARLLFVVDADDQDERDAIADIQADELVWTPAAPRAWSGPGSWAEKINHAYRHTTEPWLFAAADDVAFHPGWLDDPLRLADFDRPSYCVIGTNDLGNPRVMAGRHAVHQFVRRAYIDRYGTVDQPAAVVHEGYRHWCADDELVQTAAARGVWAPCLTSVVEHLHPYWDKAEPDDTYRYGQQFAEQDRAWFRVRTTLIMSEARRYGNEAA